MAASEEDRKAGFKAQHRARDIIEQLLKRNGYDDLIVKETGKKEDMMNKYDIYIQRADGTMTNYLFDVKNTNNIETGNISYPYMNCNGDVAVTYKKETNTKNIRLIFMFGDTSSMLYLPDMDEWYKKAPSYQPAMKGRTYVLRRNPDGTTEHIWGTRDDKYVDLYKYYHCTQVQKEYAGDIMNKYIAKPTIYHKTEEVELSFCDRGRYKNCWYFENGSKYLLVPKSDIEQMCKIGKGCIKQL